MLQLSHHPCYIFSTNYLSAKCLTITPCVCVCALIRAFLVPAFLSALINYITINDNQVTN